MCPNLTSLDCNWIDEYEADLLNHVPWSVTRLVLPYPMDYLYGLEGVGASPILVESGLLLRHVDENLKRMVIVNQTGECVVASPTLEYLALDIEATEYSLTLCCPNLTRLVIEADTTEELMKSVLTCSNLEYLEVERYSANLAMLRGLRRLTSLVVNLDDDSGRVISGSALPQSLTRLDIVRSAVTLMIESEETLPRLLMLSCCYLSGVLPKSLRVLEFLYRVPTSVHLKGIPLTSLNVDYIRDELLEELPSTLIELVMSNRLLNRPKELPSRIRRLTVYGVASKNWSFANLQYVACDGPITEEQQKEFKGHTCIVARR